MNYCLRVTFAAAVCISTSSTTVFAQSLPGGAEPGRVQERFEERASPTSQVTAVRGLESTTPPDQAEAIRLRLDGVSIVGSSVYSQSDLQTTYSNLIGQTVSLAQVFEVAARITAKYGQDGYLLSRVIVPPQSINPNGANITLQIVEGFVSEVQWPDTTSVPVGIQEGVSAQIESSRPLRLQTLERSLLITDDLPGTSVESSLVASETVPNASVLVLSIDEETTSAYVTLDNHGVEASGPVQLTVGGALNNYFGLGEGIQGQLTFAGPASSGGTELQYLSIGYDQSIGSNGLAFSFDGSLSRGDPGTEALEALDFETKGATAEVGLSYPFIRSRERSLWGSLSFEARNSSSYSLGTLSTEDRLRILQARIDFENADTLRGQNQIGIALSTGIEGLGSTANGNPNASRSPGVVDFTKLTLDVARTQQLDGGLSVYGQVFAQLTDDPLLSSQECGFGGRSYGVGFDNSIITGDTCAFASVEARWDVDTSELWGGSFDYAQVFGVADFGRIWNVEPPLGTPETDDAGSAGIGIRFGAGDFSAEAAITTILTESESQPDVESTRAWFTATMRF